MARKLPTRAARDSVPTRRVNLLMTAILGRQRRAGKKATMQLEDLLPLPVVCPLLGIPMDYSSGRGFVDSAPSIDRIDTGGGYVRGNVRVVSRRANRIKNDGTSAELRLIADNLDRLAAKE